MNQRALGDVLEIVRGVDGWLSDDQIGALYAAAAGARAGQRVVEIGSFRGRSTIVLAAAVPDDVEVIAIDPHAGNDRGPQEISGFEDQATTDHEVFIANLVAAGVAKRVRHVREFSDRAHGEVHGEIAVLFIDGAHRYEPARRDIRDWGARVEASGVMLIHDSFSSVGVTLAIARELMFGARFRYVGRARSLVEYRADLSPNLRSRLLNTGRQLAQVPWFVKNIALKIALTVHLGGLITRVTGRPPEWPY